MREQHRRRWAWMAALGALAGAAACGASDGSTDSLDAPGGAGGQSGAGGSLAETWPTSDPDPEQAPTGAPTAQPPPPTPATSCGDKSGPRGERIFTLPFKGLIRTVLLHVPDAYQPSAGTPLVLNFHGFTSDGVQEAVLSRMSQASDKHNFIVAYPYGIANSWNAGLCCGSSWTDSIDDVGFVGALIDQLEADYCIDPKRVYATGMSNGGFLSHRLACEMSDRIAAVAPVAGVMGLASCKPSRPVPVFQFHGTADQLVPYKGGNPAVNLGIPGTLNFSSVADTLAGWRQRNGCTDDSQIIYQQGDATCVRWGQCQAGSEVALCTIDGGGHTWPGGVPVAALGKTSTSLSATEAMIQFFAAHPLP